jgi:hypothetical protein
MSKTGSRTARHPAGSPILSIEGPGTPMNESRIRLSEEARLCLCATPAMSALGLQRLSSPRLTLPEYEHVKTAQSGLAMPLLQDANPLRTGASWRLR